MKNSIHVFSMNSIKFKLMVGVAFILIPLIGLLIYNNIYSINVIHNQVAESNRNMLIQYMKQVDKSLDVTDSYLATMAALDTDIQILDAKTDDSAVALATQSLSQRLNKDILSNATMDCIFIYDREDQNFIYGKRDTENISERYSVKKYIIGAINSPTQNYWYLHQKKWVVAKNNNQYYLVRIFKSGSLYVGAWVNVKQLIQQLRYIDSSSGYIYTLTTDDGTHMISSAPISDKKIDMNRDFSNYYLTGEKHQYLLVGVNSDNGDFHMIALIKNKKILENLPFLQNIITIIAFSCILFLPLSLFLLRRLVIVPLGRIYNAMKKVKEGDIEVRINPYKTTDEFELVNEIFNSMLDQIHDLRINVYEEQLSKQKEELAHLQLQVNPHFFLNSLNIIYRLAQTHKYDLIQEMSLCLMQYFRYMFQNNLAFVVIKDELMHVRNYIRIQEMRFPENLTFDMQVDDCILDSFIPPLVIQNFVENSVKYAVSLDEPVHIRVEAKHESIEGAEMVRISIQDTGKGFDKELLKQLQSGNIERDTQGGHIGIWNVRRRLQLLYNGKADMFFSNKEPNGAVVELVLPMDTL